MGGVPIYPSNVGPTAGRTVQTTSTIRVTLVALSKATLAKVNPVSQVAVDNGNPKLFCFFTPGLPEKKLEICSNHFVTRPLPWCTKDITGIQISGSHLLIFPPRNSILLMLIPCHHSFNQKKCSLKLLHTTVPEESNIQEIKRVQDGCNILA